VSLILVINLYSTSNISANFRKNSKRPKEILKAWGKLIHEKSPKPKISCQTSFKRLVQWLYLRDYFSLTRRGKGVNFCGRVSVFPWGDWFAISEDSVFYGRWLDRPDNSTQTNFSLWHLSKKKENIFAGFFSGYNFMRNISFHILWWSTEILPSVLPTFFPSLFPSFFTCLLPLFLYLSFNPSFLPFLLVSNSFLSLSFLPPLLHSFLSSFLFSFLPSFLPFFLPSLLYPSFNLPFLLSYLPFSLASFLPSFCPTFFLSCISCCFIPFYCLWGRGHQMARAIEALYG
jgi:hypothetical protein